MDVYDFNKSKRFYSYLCQELHLALLYHDSEKFSKVLNDLGLFTPTTIFRELVLFGAPQTIISQVFQHKKNNDSFIEDIKESFKKDEMTLNEVKLILNNFDSVSSYDLMNIQMLLNGSSKDMTDFRKCYSTNNIWGGYKKLNSFLDEMVSLAAYCGNFITIYHMLMEFKNCEINFEFDPENNENHKKILSMVDEGISGGLMGDDYAGNLRPTQKTYYYEFIKNFLCQRNDVFL